MVPTIVKPLTDSRCACCSENHSIFPTEISFTSSGMSLNETSKKNNRSIHSIAATVAVKTPAGSNPSPPCLICRSFKETKKCVGVHGAADFCLDGCNQEHKHDSIQLGMVRPPSRIELGALSLILHAAVVTIRAFAAIPSSSVTEHVGVTQCWQGGNADSA